MNLPDIIKKVAEGQALSSAEVSFLDSISRASSLTNSWVTPGTSSPYIPDLIADRIRIPSGELSLGNDDGSGFSGVRIAYPAFTYDGEEWNLGGFEAGVMQVGLRTSDGKFVFGGGDGWLDEYGLTFANQEGFVQFLDTSAGGSMLINADSGNSMHFTNTNGSVGAGFAWSVDNTSHEVMQATLVQQDGEDRLLFRMVGPFGDDDGSIINLSDKLMLFGAGANGGDTYVSLAASITPVQPPTGELQMYLKGNKVIFRYSDGGTVRYKYLDMTGTGVTWVHTTTAP